MLQNKESHFCYRFSNPFGNAVRGNESKDRREEYLEHICSPINDIFLYFRQYGN
jgi:hypothetical protein